MKRSSCAALMQRKSARTPRPSAVSNTFVHWLRLPPFVRSTFSTRIVRGHQRGKLYGSDTSPQTASGDAAIVRRRVTFGNCGPPRAEASVPREPAQIADEEKVLQVADGRREVLEALERLLVALWVSRAKRGTEQRLEQVRLAIGRRVKDPQVAGGHTEPGELVGGADDLAVGLVEDRLSVPRLRLDDSEVLELGDEFLTG